MFCMLPATHHVRSCGVLRLRARIGASPRIDRAPRPGQLPDPEPWTWAAERRRTGSRSRDRFVFAAPTVDIRDATLVAARSPKPTSAKGHETAPEAEPAGVKHGPRCALLPLRKRKLFGEVDPLGVSLPGAKMREKSGRHCSHSEEVFRLRFSPRPPIASEVGLHERRARWRKNASVATAADLLQRVSDQLWRRKWMPSEAPWAVQIVHPRWEGEATEPLGRRGEQPIS